MEIHPKFKLNGESYSSQELKDVAYSLVKEGDPFEISIGDFLLDWLNSSKSLTVFTSGSTGQPKEIELQKKQMVNSALATGSFFNLNSGDSALLCLPSNFIAGKMMLVRAMVLGLELDYIEPNSNPLSGILRTYDFAAMIPLQVQNGIEELNSLKKLIIGGAKVGKDLIIKLQNVNTIVYETYGMTETITHIAAKKLNHNSGKVEDYFKVLPNISIAKDERDCLVITAPKISDNKVITNDLVELVSEKEFKWLGRHDTIINSGGIKLVPEQIELKLTGVIRNRFFVAGVPDATLEKKLVLVVEGEVNKSNVNSKMAALKSLSKFEIPKTIISVEKFMESDNGKVLRAMTLAASLAN
ncbi:AMP-binding protein [uncultured Croceitalea sp.]|uniref:AMP-binding protein n=1 Tax=uncultured Croceitalea sp. TaxID=1798908 RepID=UPI0033061173